MIAQAPTLHQIFEQWKDSWQFRSMDDRGQNWTQHWEEIWAQYIAMYLQEGFHLIPLANKSKKPLDHYKWDHAKPLDQVRAMDFVRAGCNLAVVAGPSHLVILDFDSEIPEHLHDLIHLTPTVRTPRGFQFFLKEPFRPALYRRIQKRFPQMDTARTGIMYALVPPSQSDLYNEAGDKHDYRVRLWVSKMAEHPMDFERFARLIL